MSHIDELTVLQPKLLAEFQKIIQSERLSHAYLFAGDFGSLEMALYIAQSRFCLAKNADLPCGTCRTCQLIEQNQFSDVKLLEPTGTIIKTDDVRQLMRDFSKTGYESSEQVYIIKEAEKMHVNAANALLKAIEEPMNSSIMILLTSDENLILPTIKSRTQVFNFLKDVSYLTNLIEKKGVLKSDAKLLADIVKTKTESDEFVETKKVMDLLHLTQAFVEELLKDQWSAYLKVPQIVTLLSDKREQDVFWRMLTVCLAKKLQDKKAIEYINKSYQARVMWQSNVSIQNALEYMVIV